MQAYFLIPGDIDQPTGGYGYDRRVLDSARDIGLPLHHCQIPGGFPFPTEQALEQTAGIISALPGDAVLLIDGLAYGAMPTEMVNSFAPRPIVELCHHPLALEPGISDQIAASFRASETAAMALASAIIVTGPQTARIVAAEFGVPADRISVALPGTDPAPRARGSASGTLRILTVGSVIPRKGYDVLVSAMARLADLNWHLDMIGSTQYSPDTTAEIQMLVAAHDLGGRITLHGARSAADLADAYDGADLFVLSSHYEGYGMVIAEAMARGLPIVSTAAGAVVDTLDPRAGIQVPPNSIQLLAKEIREMLVSHEKRTMFSNGSWVAGQSLPRWRDTATTIARVLRDIAA